MTEIDQVTYYWWFMNNKLTAEVVVHQKEKDDRELLRCGNKIEKNIVCRDA